ncbi:MAG TPA: gliding motility-associated C-terminal domain-containing protein, partial [Bacteroidia bacterium]
ETLSEDFVISSTALDKSPGNIYMDAFYAIISLNGSTLYHCSYFGGNGEETVSALTLENGVLYFGGRSGSTDLNLTANSPNKSLIGSYDAFLVAYNTLNNHMIFVNQFGGSGDENIESIAVDQQAVYTGGYTFSAGFYCTSDALIKNYVGEQEGILVSFDKQGKKILFSTYYGGSDKDIISSIKIEMGHLYAAGITLSNNFPVSVNALYGNVAKNRNGFAFKLDLKTKTIVYSTYLPAAFKVQNTQMEVKLGIAMIANVLPFNKSQYISEYLCDSNQLKNNDIFVCALNESGSSMKYATFLGELNDEIFPSMSWRDCEITLGFNSYSSGLPTTNGAWLQQRISVSESAIAWFKIKPNFEFLQLKNLKKLAPKYNLCKSGKITLNSGYEKTLWPDGSIDSTFTVYKPGTYILNVFIGCDSIYRDTCLVDSLPMQIHIGRDTTFCNKNFKLKLSSNQDSTYWSTGARGKSITIHKAGTYWANSNARCSNRNADSLNVIYLAEDDWVKLPKDTSICKGSKLRLTVKTQNAIWWNGFRNDHIEIDQAGQYSVSAINSCHQWMRDTIRIDTIAIKRFQLPPDTLICKKQVNILLNTHLDGTNWSGGEIDSVKTIQVQGTYIANYTNVCGISHSDTFTLKTDTGNIQFNLGRDTSFCGQIKSFKLSSGIQSTFWSTGERGPYILVSDSGLYHAETRNICFESFSDSINLSIIKIPKIDLPKDTFICGKTNILLDAKYDNAKWQNGDIGRFHRAEYKGTYYASVLNQCGYFRDTFMIKTDTAALPFFIPNAFSPSKDGINETFPPQSLTIPEFSLKVYNRWGQMVHD